MLVAESGPAWANAVIRILRDQQLRAELVADAYEHLKPWAQDQVATEPQSAYRAAVVSQESGETQFAGSGDSLHLSLSAQLGPEADGRPAISPRRAAHKVQIKLLEDKPVVA